MTRQGYRHIETRRQGGVIRMKTWPNVSGSHSSQPLVGLNRIHSLDTSTYYRGICRNVRFYSSLEHSDDDTFAGGHLALFGEAFEGDIECDGVALGIVGCFHSFEY